MRKKELHEMILLFFLMNARCLVQIIFEAMLKKEGWVWKLIVVVWFDNASRYSSLVRMGYYTCMIRWGLVFRWLVKNGIANILFEGGEESENGPMKEVKCFLVLDYILLQCNCMCGDQMICRLQLCIDIVAWHD